MNTTGKRQTGVEIAYDLKLAAERLLNPTPIATYTKFSDRRKCQCGCNSTFLADGDAKSQESLTNAMNEHLLMMRIRQQLRSGK